MEEKRYRSLVKAASWRLTGTLDTILVSFIITGAVKTAFSIGLLEILTKMTLYYVHERAWNKIRLGRTIVTESEYNI
ncbi:MAG: hypothetical protein A2X49_02390 [Lentisphaerae bacterium GWF2_52_8]|nr:MAG: hypothetical protein A2X49_02390 [Lentisphaerae bacterium GWF2_52_8]